MFSEVSEASRFGANSISRGGRVLDRHGRPAGDLRISVTDRCNLRCRYCMPEREYRWLNSEDILSFDEAVTLIGVYSDLGVSKVRLTGGEPLLRPNVDQLIRQIRRSTSIREVAMTSNGVLLAEQASTLREAGLDRVTVSLDTLDARRFHLLTGANQHARVVEAINEVQKCLFLRTKLDCVIMRGVNDDEICALFEYGRQRGIEVRFIEYMDVGGATRWDLKDVVTMPEILQVLSVRYGAISPIDETSPAPARRFSLQDGTVFGIIASTTAPFCGACNRSRLTADGIWYLCLYSERGIDLRRQLRGGATREALRETLDSCWRGRSDRGAEVRAQAKQRQALFPAERLKRDPHLEMHTRGG